MATVPSTEVSLDTMYRMAFDAGADGLIILEAGRIVAANPAACQLLGADEPEDQLLLDFIPPRLHADVLAAIEDGGECETRLLPTHGPVRPVLLRAHAPNPDLGLIILRDMTAAPARKQTQHARDAELERLEQLNHFKTQLLNTAAHELNTPLTPLRLQVHLLRSENLGQLTERQGRAVDVLERSTERLSMLVSDILDVARLESGHLRMEVEDTLLSDLIDETAQAYGETARGVGVALQVELKPGLLVRIDPRRILQVLYNLVSNAIKFTPEGGRVVIRTGITGSQAFVEVVDTGLGLDSQQIDALFQPFGRVHDTETTAIPGTGLGLYISRGIVKQHGGQLTAASPGPGRGSCFRFTVPMAAEPLSPARPKLASRSALVAGPLAQRLRELI